MRKLNVSEHRMLFKKDVIALITSYVPDIDEVQMAYALSYIWDDQKGQTKNITPWALYHIAHHISYCMGEGANDVLAYEIMEALADLTHSTFKIRRTHRI